MKLKSALSAGLLTLAFSSPLIAAPSYYVVTPMSSLSIGSSTPGGGGSGGSIEPIAPPLHPDRDAPEREEDGRWWKSPVTGIIYCKGVPAGEMHVFDGDAIKYVSIADGNKLGAANNTASACTSNMTDMGAMPWPDKANFNEPLNLWDTSSVREMMNMFGGASSFDQPLNNWDVSRVRPMSYIFSRASNFNQDLSSWCVSLISSKPSSFDAQTPAWDKEGHQPVWGTRPSAP